METKFKLGDEVYDSFEFPNEKGNIKSLIYGVNGLSNAVVQFEKEEIIYKGKHLHRLSFTPYELKGFTQERPWTPKKGEWIAVRKNSNEHWKLAVFQARLKEIYITLCGEWSLAKPLTYFTQQNEKL